MNPLPNSTLSFWLHSHTATARHTPTKRETSFSCWGRGFCGCVRFVSFPIHQFSVVAGRSETLSGAAQVQQAFRCGCLALWWLLSSIGRERAFRLIVLLLSAGTSASDFRGLVRGLMQPRKCSDVTGRVHSDLRLFFCVESWMHPDRGRKRFWSVVRLSWTWTTPNCNDIDSTWRWFQL